MSDQVEEKLKEPDPIAEGHVPTREEKILAEEHEEKDKKQRVESLRQTLSGLRDDGNPKLAEARSRLMADPKMINEQDLTQMTQTINDEAVRQNQQNVGTLAGIGAVLALLGVRTDGNDYHPVQTGTGDLPRNIAELPGQEQARREENQGFIRQLTSI